MILIAICDQESYASQHKIHISVFYGKNVHHVQTFDSLNAELAYFAACARIPNNSVK